MNIKSNMDYRSDVLSELPESYIQQFKEEKKYLQTNTPIGANVLEIGCGDGRSIEDLIEKTHDIIGIDHDKEWVMKSQKRFSDIPSIKILEADATKLPFENNMFDIISCMNVFVNFGSKKYEILKEIKRVLKPGGKILMSAFSENALHDRLMVYKRIGIGIKKILENGTVIFDFDEKLGDSISEQFNLQQLKNIFSEADLQIKNIVKTSIEYIFTLEK